MSILLLGEFPFENNTWTIVRDPLYFVFLPRLVRVLVRGNSKKQK